MKLVDLNKPIAELNGLTLNEVFDRNILLDVTALPNGVKYYEVSGGNIVQRVQEYILQGTDIVLLQTTVSQYDFVRINLTSFIGVKAQTVAGIGDFFIPDFQPEFSAAVTATVIPSFATATTQIFLHFAKGKYANLAAAQADLAGTKILYQLATPITIVTGISITQAQLDNYFALYQSGVEASGFVQKTFSGDTKFALAQGIDAVAHGGKTYREIFEGGNKLDTEYLQSLVTNTNDTYNILLSSAAGLIENNKQYYFTAYNNMPFTFRVRVSSPTLDFSIPTLTSNSFTFSTTVQTTLRLWVFSSDIIAPFIPHIFDVYFLNLTDLFGAGNEPDKATMDKLFQQYEEAGTVQAQAFIQTAGKDTRVIDAKLPYLNMMSIREVFDSNLVVNGDFSDGLNNWSSNTSVSLSLDNNALKGISIVDGNFDAFSIPNISYTSGNNIYISYDVKGNTSKTFGFRGNISGTIFTNANTTLTNNFVRNTYLRTVNQTTNSQLRFFISGAVVSDFATVDNVVMVNLTALNLTHLTQAELDAMFALYQAGTLKLSDVFEDNQASSIATLSQTQQDDIAKAYTRYKSPLFIDTDGVAYGQVFISKGGQ